MLLIIGNVSCAVQCEQCGSPMPSSWFYRVWKQLVKVLAGFVREYAIQGNKEHFTKSPNLYHTEKTLTLEKQTNKKTPKQVSMKSRTVALTLPNALQPISTVLHGTVTPQP